MVLGKLPVPGRPTIWITVGQGPTALVVVAGGGCLDIFTIIYPFSPLSPSLQGSYRREKTKFPDISLTQIQISLTKTIGDRQNIFLPKLLFTMRQ